MRFLYNNIWEHVRRIQYHHRLWGKAIVDYLKGIVPPKCKFLLHSLTLLLFQICRIYFVSAEHKRYFEECLKVFWSTVKVKGIKCWYCWTSQTLIVWTKTVLQNIFFCVPQTEKKLHGFGTTWRWVNEDTICIFEWTSLHICCVSIIWERFLL